MIGLEQEARSTEPLYVMQYWLVVLQVILQSRWFLIVLLLVMLVEGKIGAPRTNGESSSST
jgi:hypothetical protein